MDVSVSFWICQFQDDAEMLSVRDEYRSAHKEFLHKSRSRILFAGPVFDEGTGQPYGAIWLVHGTSVEDVMIWLETDPYFASGHRKVEISMWKSAMPDFI